MFQYDFDVSQQAIIVSMVGSRTTKKTSDPVAVLKSVCHEGCDTSERIVRVRGGRSAEPGQVHVIRAERGDKGTTVGYYLFRRFEANRREVGDPLNQSEAPSDAT